jgi:hypothetical protein
MSLTRRLRSYFFGPDGESYKKFSTSNKPDKSMFNNLFQSLGFLKESDDTATITQQGFVELSGDVDAANCDSTKHTTRQYAKVVQPHQLPIIDAGNGVSVAKNSNATGRTGGNGNRYTVSNNMSVTKASGSILDVTQTGGAGNDVVLDVNNTALDTLIGAKITSQVGTPATIASVTTVSNKVDSGKIGEVRMYSSYNRTLGDSLFEFDVNGVGRNIGIDGAKGDWVGWIIIKGQGQGSFPGYNDDIVKNIFYNPALNTYTAPDTTSRVPIGYSSNKGFDLSGADGRTLVKANIPLDAHRHKNTPGSGLVEPTTPYDPLQVSATNIYSKHVHRIQTVIATAGTDAGFIYTTTGTANIINAPTMATGSQATEMHGHTISGYTDESSAQVASVDVDIRQKSFVVFYAMYVGCTGSNI